MKLRPGFASVRRALIPSMAMLLSVTAAVRADEAMRFNIVEQPLVQALKAFAEQADMQLLYKQDAVAGATATAVIGNYAKRGALEQLLSGTGLEVVFMSDGSAAIRIKSEHGGRSSSLFKSTAHDVINTVRLAQAEETTAESSRSQSGEAHEAPELKGIPSILVTAARTLNMDIERSEDDLQPYVVFDRKEIEGSGAVSLDQFFQQRLTMSAGPANRSEGINTSISLRGLGAGQTLILVDGRRMTGPSAYGVQGQADISGIPLAAIERIEILPTTASGIYGGSATGGAINIILRRDYSGAEVNVTYENTFDSDTPSGKVDFSFGHHFNERRTSLLFGGNFSDASILRARDRDFIQQGRVEIMQNDPSFLFAPTGVPPLANRPNISSRDGSLLVLDNGTALGSSFTSVPQGYAGIASDGGAALAARAGTYNWDLSNTANLHSRGSGGLQSLNAPTKTKFGMLSLRHEFSDSLQGFVDLSASDWSKTLTSGSSSVNYTLPANSPNNPFQQAISVTLPLNGMDYGNTVRTEGRRGALGLIKRLNSRWQLGGDFSWSKSSIAYDASPGTSSALAAAITGGSIDVLRDTVAYPVDASAYVTPSFLFTPFESTMKETNVRIAGPVWELPAGAVTLSGSLGYRTEDLAAAWLHYRSSGASYFYPERSQDVKSAYVELRVPLFSPTNARPGLRELELQLAVRGDAYTSNSGQTVTMSYVPGQAAPSNVLRSESDFTSVDPTIALRWAPIEDLATRFSYGTGFVPPGLNQLVTSTMVALNAWYTDPLRGGELVGTTSAGPETILSGGNPELKPEQSESWSAGFIYSPRQLPGMRLSVDYTHIKKTDTISTHPRAAQGVVDDEALLAGRVVRGPNLPGDPAGWAGPIILIDNRYMNLAESWLEAWDVRLDMKHDTHSYGVFDFMLLGTWQPHYVTRTLPWAEDVENAGVGTDNPLRFRGTAGVSWSKDAWRVGWNSSYYHSYKLASYSTATEIAIQGNGGVVPKQIYHDVFASYDFGLSGTASSWLDKTEIQLGIRNIFNEAPPFDANARYFGMFSPYGDPRMATYSLSIKKAF